MSFINYLITNAYGFGAVLTAFGSERLLKP
jgi:hypothetical protein